MSKRSQDKRRARAREKAKEARRQRGIGPLARLAEGDGQLECWIQYAPQDDRMRNIVVFRRMHGGGSVAAFFLLDFDCIGLKDAFFHLDVSPREIIEKYRQQDEVAATRLEKLDPQEVREQVAAAIRWTRDHHFRLPIPTERCLKILGGELDMEGADLSEFGLEGGRLNYVGLKADLRKRLLNQSLEEFLARDDVIHTFMDGFDEDEDFADDEADTDEEELTPIEAGEEVARVQDAFGKKLLTKAREWCFANGQAPHEKLEDAVRMWIDAAGQAFGEKNAEAAAAVGDESVARLIEMEPENDRGRIREAMHQLYAFLGSFDSSEQLAQVLGVDESFDDDA